MFLPVTLYHTTSFPIFLVHLQNFLFISTKHLLDNFHPASFGLVSNSQTVLPCSVIYPNSYLT